MSEHTETKQRISGYPHACSPLALRTAFLSCDGKEKRVPRGESNKPLSVASFPWQRRLLTASALLHTHGHAGWACPQSQPRGESSAAFGAFWILPRQAVNHPG